MHGIPGLPAPVEVFADGSRLFAFDFGDTRGPLDLPSATYFIEVKLNGTTVLSTNARLEPGGVYTAVAHLQVGGGNQLSLFREDASPIAPGSTRLAVRHLADAPAVDAALEQNGSRIATIPGLRNPNEAVAGAPAGRYDVSLFAAGTGMRVFGPASLDLSSRFLYAVHAVGDLAGGSFRLVVVARDLDFPALELTFSGSSCGGSIWVSTNAPVVAEPFSVLLTNAEAGTMAVLYVGDSDQTFGSTMLPLELSAFGAPGCRLYQNALIALPAMTDATGTASMTLTIPRRVASVLAPTYWQWGWADAGANALGFRLTEYATLSTR